MKVIVLASLGFLVAGLSACGTNNEQRSATGAGTGAVIGGLAGGPVGLAIGAGAGAVAGDQEKNVENKASQLKNENQQPSSERPRTTTPPG